jgi:hypothetical protein
MVPSWKVASDPAGALRSVLDPSFDPRSEAVVERDPGIPQAASIDGSTVAPGTASYREQTPEDVLISVNAAVDSLVVVRNNWDEGWSATVDGRPSPVLRADYFRQAVAVPPGRHEVRLVYRDPRVGRGLAASALVWSIFVVVFGAAIVLERLRRRRAQPAPLPADTVTSETVLPP